MRLIRLSWRVVVRSLSQTVGWCMRVTANNAEWKHCKLSRACVFSLVLGTVECVFFVRVWSSAKWENGIRLVRFSFCLLHILCEHNKYVSLLFMWTSNVRVVSYNVLILLLTVEWWCDAGWMAGCLVGWWVVSAVKNVRRAPFPVACAAGGV